MSDKNIMKPELWTPRPVEETIEVYREWAATYDADLEDRGYRTPDRLAAALTDVVPPDETILDFGCGTGVSGIALRKAGFQHIHGTDLTPEMLEKTAALDVYEKTWPSTADDPRFDAGAYRVIAAVGVVSLGAAPPSTLAMLISKLPQGGILAFSYNEPTLLDESYINALEDEVGANRVEVISRASGPHLEKTGMSSDVIVLRRT